MENLNEHITDAELRALLKLRILKGEENDPLTEELIRAESVLAFNNPAEISVTENSEKEFLNQLIGSNKVNFFPWLFGALLCVSVASALFYLFPVKKEQVREEVKAREKNQAQNAAGSIEPYFEKPIVIKPTTINKKIKENDEAVYLHKEEVLPEPEIRTNAAQHAVNAKKNKYLWAQVAESGLTVSELEEYSKEKQIMINQIIKRDKKAWSFIQGKPTVYRGNSYMVYAFYISVAEVSNKQYRTFLTDILVQGKYEEYEKALPDTTKWREKLAYNEPYVQYYFRHPAYDNYPVVNISPQAAQLYCRWLSESVNEVLQSLSTKEPMVEVRLPVDLEWVKAARGGNPDAVFGWKGNEPQTKKKDMLGNFKRGVGDSMGVSGKLNDNADITAPVKSYWPNDYGIYNMSGNVSEMVYISIGNTLEDSISNNEPCRYIDFAGKPQFIAAKGGSWGSTIDALKIDAPEEYKGLQEGSPFVGFRPVFIPIVIP
jgi:formylglycine-generating enzyme required for sulfatase activity